jgi:hypothetical protein
LENIPPIFGTTLCECGGTLSDALCCAKIYSLSDGKSQLINYIKASSPERSFC